MTRKLSTNFNVAPYYDDYDELKNFLRIVFNPAKPVQSRELTQLQTILNNQLSRIGNHVFQDGSVVIPGNFSVDTELEYIKLQDETITISEWDGETITNAGGSKFYVTKSATKVSASEPSVLIGYYISGSNVFDGDDVLTNTTADTVTVASTSFSGSSSVATVTSGIFYTSGFFVRCDQQTIILDKFTNTPSYRIGLTVKESIVKNGDDSTLLDVAQGSPNATAPGADRFKIELTLAKKNIDTGSTITNNSSEDFYEFVRMVSGVKTDQKIHPQYSYLGEQLARRTFDTNGNFTVRNFAVDVDTHPTDTAKLRLTLDPGKAYVHGYEIETIYPKFLDVDRARDFKSISSENISTYLGNYVYVTFPPSAIGGTTNLIPSFTTQSKVTLRSDVGDIGTARIRQLRQSGSDYILNLFDIKLTGDIKDFTEVVEFETTNANVIFNVAAKSKVSGSTSLTDTNKKSLILPVSKSSIKTTPSTPERYTEFVYSKYTTAVGNALKEITVSLESGVETFTASDATLNQTESQARFILLDRDTGVQYTVMSSVISGESTNAVITVNDDINEKNISVFSIVQLKNPTTRTKTKKTDGSKTIDTDLADAKITGKWVSLTRSDIIAIKSIKMSDTTDVTSSYEFDNGQRDTHYDHGRIRLKPGATVPNEDTSLTVLYDYFSHSSANGGFFDVDSYVSIDYDDIPEYEDSDGKLHNLSNVIDFRPVIDDSGNIADNRTPLGDAGQFLEVDYDYYVPRIDKVILTKEKEFKVIKGIPAEFPVSPPDDKNAMTLYVLTVPPYTFTPNELSVKPVKNKRYTMADISLLDRRLQELESTREQTQLKTTAKNILIRNDSGTEVLKNGILVDDFTGHSVGDINNADYSCSIDFETGELRPAFESNNHSFTFDSDTSVNAKKTGPLLTSNYTSKLFLDQPLANKTTKINPHNMVSWFGDLTISPNSDTWFSRSLDPKVTINSRGENDAWESTALAAVQNIGKGFGTQWNDWQSIWSGVDLDKSDDETNPNAILLSKSELLGRRETENSLVDSSSKLNSITRFLPDRIDGSVRGGKLDISVVPFMRANTVHVIGRNLKPNTQLYGFFDDVDVTTNIALSTKIVLSSPTGTFNDKLDEWETLTSGDTTGKLLLKSVDSAGDTVLYVSPILNEFQVTNIIEGANGSGTIATITTPANLKTDEYGQVTGILTIPETSVSKIRSGQRLLRLTDSPTNDLSTTKTLSENPYLSQGVISDPETFIISTRLPKTKRNSISDDSSINRDIFSREINTLSRDLKWKDPLAQSFVVDRSKYRNGLMLESLDLYFKTKDTDLPVAIEIRPNFNGFPSTSLIVPFSEVSVLPSDVVINAGPDATKTTNFVFQAPVYLTPGEYSIIIKTNSTKYELFSGEFGFPVLDSDGTVDTNNTKITKQPNIGTLFLSQNAGLWEANTNESLMFKLNSCKFTTGETDLYFDIAALSSGTEEFSIFKLTSSTLDNFFDTTNSSFSYRAKLKGPDSSIDVGWTNVIENKNIEELRTLELSTSVDFKLKVSSSTNDENISPVFDMERLSIITTRNIVNNLELSDSDIVIVDGGTGYTDGVHSNIGIDNGSNTSAASASVTVSSNAITAISVDSNTKMNENLSLNTSTIPLLEQGSDDGVVSINHEELASGGIATAKYISRRVKLESSRFSTDLRAYLDLYKPTGTDVFVYYKIHNSSSDLSFDENPWSLMNQITASYTLSSHNNDYKEFIFGTDATGAKPTGFENFDTFSIKIVFVTANTFTVPKARNLKVFALDSVVQT